MTADVTVLATGGTIDKVYNLAGQLEIGPPAARTMLEVLRTELRGTCGRSSRRTASTSPMVIAWRWPG